MKLINPIYKKELKQAARMSRTAILILFYNAALALFGLFAYYVSFNSEKTYRIFIDYSGILSIYIIITGIEFVLILFLVPALTAGSIVGEKEKQTLDILLTTGITPKKIVNGKLLASISTIIFLAISSLPIISIVFSIGGITLWDLFKFMLLLIVTAIYLGSIAILFSCICRRTTAATVCAYSCMLFLVAGTAAIFFGAAVMYNSSTFGTWEYQNMLWYSDRTGKFIYLLFLNPLVSYIAMLKDQIGIGNEILGGIAATGNLPLFISNKWFEISMIIQIIFSLLILWLASHKLNPLKK